MSDISEQVNAVTRTVGSRTVADGEARVVTLSRSYRTDLEDLWDACTNIERIPRWFLPLTGELKLGGHYQFEGHAGGTIERCDPPHGFDATWEYGGDVSWIEVRLSAEPNGCSRFELQHVVSVDDERWAEFGPGAVGVGWDSGLLGLSWHLETAPGAPNGPEAGAAWAGSEEGKRFMALSSESWGAANLAAGADEAAVQEAVARTTAAYTGS
ncbi:MAG TPA: SRPBCC family protein [Kineosporiaceae bacterium]|nr:SRPBCC family protein [Kineosporiaceae bacterium]